MKWIHAVVVDVLEAIVFEKWARILTCSIFAGILAGVGLPLWTGISAAVIAFGITFAILIVIEKFV